MEFIWSIWINIQIVITITGIIFQHLIPKIYSRSIISIIVGLIVSLFFIVMGMFIGFGALK